MRRRAETGSSGHGTATLRACLRALAAAGAVTGSLAHAASALPASLAECAGIADNGSRLACYDRLAAASDADTRKSANAPPPAESVKAQGTSAGNEAQAFSLARHWEVGQENKRGIFAFRPHRPNYIIAKYSSSPNEAPYRPFRRIVPDSQGLSHGELAFQLGFKMKTAENLLDSPADLWFAYTQESFWQAGNHEASSPFRESNYQPEMMLVVPADFALLGMRARFVNFGLVHQSNGQTSTLSRSWNRVYAQLGLERGKFTLLARAWKRLSEDAATDDNPRINDYMGYGDLLGTYRHDGHEWSLLARHNFRTGHGAVQAGWAFPLAGMLKGYVQLFSGYGQSLIDYDHAQQSIGLGVLVSY